MSTTVIVGGGLVGLGTARALKERDPGARILLLEKESEVAAHQTGHNSGVVHSGIYYRPGSLRARLCTEGARLMAAYCTARNLPFERCGKVIVATSEPELPRLEALAQRAQANGLEVHRLGPEAMKEREPHAAGLAALWLPGTAVTDYRQVTRSLLRELASEGVEVRLGTAVTGLEERPSGVRVCTRDGEIMADRVVACAGLHADRVAAFQAPPPVRIVPFRGEYHDLTSEGAELVKGLIYPVPDPALPFLGVHLTRMAGGGVEAGPNAVLALAREGYAWGTVSAADLRDTFTYGGFWRLARRHGRSGAYEMLRSVLRPLLVRDLQRLVPALEDRHLVPGGAGVRAQAVLPTGELADDFVLHHHGRCLHVLNAPSPAATASLAIGAHIATSLEQA